MILYLNVFMVSIFNMFILAELSHDENFNLKDTSCDNHMIRIIPNNDNILIQKGDTISTTGMTTTITTLHDRYYNGVYYANYEWVYHPVTLVWDWAHVPVVEKVQPVIEELQPVVENSATSMLCPNARCNNSRILCPNIHCNNPRIAVDRKAGLYTRKDG